MLEQLTLRNFVFSKNLVLNFSAGFCVLTGDSGAGKSLLVNALSTLLGAKLSPNLVADTNSAEIEALFAVASGSTAATWLADNELTDEENEGLLIVRRTIGSGGKRSSSFVNGRQVALSQLSEVVAMVMEICGQQSHYSLRLAPAQREILDGFANANNKQVAMLYKTYQASHKQWQQALIQQKEADAQQTLLTQSLVELQTLDFSQEKWTQMDTTLSQITHSSDLIQGCQRALQQLDGDDFNIQSMLASVKNEMELLVRIDERLNNVVTTLNDIMALSNDVTHDVSRYAESIQFDFQTQDEINTYVAQCHHLARKYGVSSPALLGEYQNEVEAALAALPTAQQCDRLGALAQSHRDNLLEACQELTDKRQRAAQLLSDSINVLLKKLAMAKAEFAVMLEALSEPTATGYEHVSFNIRTRATMAMGSIGEVASGGELSRIGLAISLSSGEVVDKSVSIFDEVDSGVSGAIASEIGQLLQMLGKTRQVICVTHLPQVAAYADAHWLVVGGNALTVNVLDGDNRVEEIARLHSGSKITEAARQHAKEMLADAHL